jgi:hypothetical protein
MRDRCCQDPQVIGVFKAPNVRLQVPALNGLSIGVDVGARVLHGVAAAIEWSDATLSANAALIGAATLALISDIAARSGRASPGFDEVDTGNAVAMLTILLIVLIVLLLTGGGGYYARGRRRL